MDTNRLRQFCTVVETGNLRRASELIGISHSGLSKSMKTLEAEVGLSLLLPNGRGIVVSDDGMRLYRRCAPFFTELRRLLDHAESSANPPVRIGSFEVFTTFFIGTLLKSYLSDADVDIYDLVPGKLEEALLLDRIDLGITYEPIPRPGIEYVKVARIEMGLYVRRGEFAGKDVLSIPFVIPADPLEGAPSGVKGSDGWSGGERHRRQVRYRVDSMTTGIELVRQGLCAIFMPRFVAQLHDSGTSPSLRLEERELPAGVRPVRRDVYVVKRESTPETSAFRRVAKAIREICR